jgi:hypothetical protein
MVGGEERWLFLLHFLLFWLVTFRSFLFAFYIAYTLSMLNTLYLILFFSTLPSFSSFPSPPFPSLPRHQETDIRYRLLGSITPPFQQFKIKIKSPTQKKQSTNLGPGYGTYGDTYPVLTGAEADFNSEGEYKE